MKKGLKIFGGSLLVLGLIQLVPVDRENKPVDKNTNFVDVLKTPSDVQKILKVACYDCHSNETIYPRYAYIAPISWSIKHHINRGREHLNFSEWASYNTELKKGMMEKSIQTIRYNKMPMGGYVAQHPEARLTEQEKKTAIHYFQKILENMDAEKAQP